jgi:hypothetical protein
VDPIGWRLVDASYRGGVGRLFRDLSAAIANLETDAIVEFRLYRTPGGSDTYAHPVWFSTVDMHVQVTGRTRERNKGTGWDP